LSATNPSMPLMPGFEFLQNLVKNAGAALPHIGQWVAPTLDPQELDKRIQELRTVQFWLEQNARMLGATVQAMEVQRMTLSTLKTMNVQMDDLRKSLQVPVPPAPQAAAPKPGRPTTAAASPLGAPAAAEPQPKPAGAVDPLQWWSALTQQFTELASAVIQEGVPPTPTKPQAPPSPPAAHAPAPAHALARAPARASAATAPAKKVAPVAKPRSARNTPPK
jgi:hypothetical protein